MTLGTPPGRRAARPASPPRCQFLPPYLLQQVATDPAAAGADPGAGLSAAAASATLVHDRAFRAGREAAAASDRADAAPGAIGPAWSVHTAANTTSLPGARVRSEGEPASGDVAVDEAAVGGSGALALFADVYGRNSFDDAGAPVVMTVHYGRSYDNAFWNGRQLVFGDGDGRIFDRFTKPVDVLGHELTHAVTQYTAGLVYRNQSGALNESVSDVFAACAKQRMLGQSVTEADWLIGAGLFLPGVDGRALRDMAAPGTAYDDPVLGRDPQAGHMDGYVVTSDDNGGVHLNSGIPNRAFHLAAMAIGGTSWDGAGAIWYAALTGPAVGPDTAFAGFAAATVAAAGEHAAAVTEAWRTVGVEPDDLSAGGAGAGVLGSSADLGPASAAEGGFGSTVLVRRSGGFTGRTTEGAVDLDSHDPRAAEVRALIGRVDLDQLRTGPSHPDQYVYRFSLPQGEVLIPEQDLTDDLRLLADLVLPTPPR
jgi:hypothetical protein